MTSDINSKITSTIESKISCLLSQDDIPGLIIGVVKNGRLCWSNSYGYSDLTKKSVANQLTLHRIASITKTFTAIAIMQLRDIGSLELDDPLVSHVPDFAAAIPISGTIEGVTIRRLLTHHSGLTTEHESVAWDVPQWPTHKELVKSLDKIQIVLPQDHQWKYSNLAYALLGHLISQITKTRYTEYVIDEIVKPLGLTSTVFDRPKSPGTDFATGYARPKPNTKKIRLAPYQHLSGFDACGQLISNVRDLSNWVSFFMPTWPENGSTQIISSDSVEEMLKPAYISDDWTTGQALGWRLFRRNNKTYYNHGGGINGFSSNVVFNRPTKIGVIVLSNVWPTTIPYAMAEYVCELVVEYESANTEPNDITFEHLKRKVYEKYEGNYWAEPGIRIDVSLTLNGLFIEVPKGGAYHMHGPSQIIPTETCNSFKVASGRGAGELVRFEIVDGNPVSFTLGGFKYIKI